MSRVDSSPISTTSGTHSARSKEIMTPTIRWSKAPRSELVQSWCGFRKSTSCWRFCCLLILLFVQCFYQFPGIPKNIMYIMLTVFFHVKTILLLRIQLTNPGDNSFYSLGLPGNCLQSKKGIVGFLPLIVALVHCSIWHPPGKKTHGKTGSGSNPPVVDVSSIEKEEQNSWFLLTNGYK